MSRESAACSRWTILSDREAIGGALSPEEHRYLYEHPASCDLCGAIAEAHRELEGLLEPIAERGSRVHRRADVASARARVVRRTARVAFAAFALAACAAVVFFWRSMKRAAPVPEVMTAHLSSVNGGVYVDGIAARAGESLTAGAIVLTRTGRACIDIRPARSNTGNIHACLSPASVVRAGEIEGARRRLDVLAGKLAVELDPQPTGTSFTVATREGTVTAIGTAFSVEVPEDGGPVVTRVLHGIVAVRSNDSGDRRVGAHAQIMSMGGDVTPLPEDIEIRERQLLDPAQVVTEAPPASAFTPPVATPSSPPPSKASSAPQGETTNAAEKLLITPRARSAAGDLRGAAEAYRELLTSHPRSAEANAVRVPYGELELGIFGNAASALALFEQYLAVGGPLAEEASYGRIRALRALGRTDEERTAIGQFLEQFPEASAASSLRNRQRTISEAR